MSHFESLPLRCIIPSQHCLVLLVIFWTSISLARGPASSGSGGGSHGAGFMQRAEARESKRWTLQEWLEQKNRNTLMDQWLMMNSPSPFEFSIAGSSLSYKTMVDNPTSELSYSSSFGEFAAYAQSVGLSLEYENNQQEIFNDVSALLNIRLLGNSLQSTSVTLSGGQRTRTTSSLSPEVQVKNTLAQLSLQAYLTKYFGIEGTARNYFPVNDSTFGQVSGSRYEAGLFIDYKAFRIFGSWFQDLELRTTTSTSQEIKRTGTKTGFKIYF